MAGQEHKSPQRREGEPDDGPPPAAAPETQARKEELDDDIDAMLDEIDDVLETNAEDFVRGFVQKGGE
jgi:ubiquitin-like protein Pup